MSAIPGEIGASQPALEESESRESPGFDLPVAARLFFLLVAAGAVGAALPFIRRLGDHHSWVTFTILAASAAVAQLFDVRTPRNQSYHTTTLFLIPAVLLLPPELIVFIGAIQHIPEWLKTRYRWYIQTFNIFNWTLTLLAAWGAVHAVGKLGVITSPTLQVALEGLAAVLVMVMLNHASLAIMLRLARGHTLRETGLFSVEGLTTELSLASLGVGVAFLWGYNPWLIPFAISPLVLIHRSLSVPALQAEARVDAKTGLYNARYFATALAEEIARAQRFNRPLSVIMADLDLLRDINNSYGHLAGDAVLKGIADVFRTQLRHYDVPARFGGEEFSILLPETTVEKALEIAERIRRNVAQQAFEVETSNEPIRATISMGVAAYPEDGTDPSELIHRADLAVYRAKMQGRNRVLAAGDTPLLAPGGPGEVRIATVPEDGEYTAAVQRQPGPKPQIERRREPAARPHTLPAPRFVALSWRVWLLVALVAGIGIAAGAVGAAMEQTNDIVGLVVIAILVGVGQALALEVDDGSISVSAVGALVGAALFGPLAALPVALVIVAVEWSARRNPIHYVLYNAGSLTLASLAAAALFDARGWLGLGQGFIVVAGLLAGGVYFAVNTGLVSLALALEGHERWFKAWQERFRWLMPHYVVYGFIAGVVAIAYTAAGLYIIVVFAVPVLLMRRTQEAYVSHARKVAQKLREAAETIQSQNVSLEQANRLLIERSTAAMESLSATVDARDSYTAGHSRRVQRLSLAIGRELGLSQTELDLLGHAALFHDIGKLAIPDNVLLKPGRLTSEEWSLMQSHAEEGARIIARLGFLDDAVPAIRHHHERFNGAGYPQGIGGEEIPLGARIIHVADAVDSMLTTRTYRAALPLSETLAELRAGNGQQFCPRCVSAFERVLEKSPAEMGLPVTGVGPESDRLLIAI